MTFARALTYLAGNPCLGLLVTALLLAGCASDPFRADVTRFHADRLESLRGAQVAILPFADESAPPPGFSEQAHRVGEALALAGFRPAGEGEADIVARMRYTVSPLQTARESGIRIGIGGGHFGDNVGVSGGFSFPVGERDPQLGYSRRLELTLYDPPTGQRIWEGRAISAGRSPDHMRSLSLLAHALLRDFPGVSGETIKVKIPVDKNGRPLSDIR